jgi:antibiotic biosynthesis monooxygenase (ABM) superfamily enzyme
MAWFQRKDIMPAYKQVTLIWAILFTLRGVLQLNLYLKGSVGALAFTNLILGFPFTATVLLISYVYGLYKLQKLKGPSVDEFISGKEPPYQGQKKGF